MDINKINKLLHLFQKRAQVLELGQSAQISGLEAEITNQLKNRELSNRAPVLGDSLLKGLSEIDEHLISQYPHENLLVVAEQLSDGDIPDKQLLYAAIQEFKLISSFQNMTHLKGQLEMFL